METQDAEVRSLHKLHRGELKADCDNFHCFSQKADLDGLRILVHHCSATVEQKVNMLVSSLPEGRLLFIINFYSARNQLISTPGGITGLRSSVPPSSTHRHSGKYTILGQFIREFIHNTNMPRMESHIKTLCN
jgi:hypothetical protein